MGNDFTSNKFMKTKGIFTGLNFFFWYESIMTLPSGEEIKIRGSIFPDHLQISRILHEELFSRFQLFSSRKETS